MTHYVNYVAVCGKETNEKVTVLNDQGGGVMSVEEDKVGTLRTEAHGNNPIVFEAAGFKPEQWKDARGLGYKEEQAPTLTGNTPAVVYGICSKDSNSMKSSNPHSGFYEADKSRTLDTNGANPNCNQGGNVVVYALEGNGSRPSHRGDGWAETEKMYTLNTIERHAVAQPMSTTGGAGLHNEQGKFHDELDGRQGADTGGNRLERCSCSCSGKQTVGSLCAHDGRGFNGQDVAQGKLIIEYETDNDG